MTTKERHPAATAGALMLRVEMLFDAAMRDSTPELHDHMNRINELYTELQDGITRREIEMSMAAKCEEVGRDGE